MLYDPEKHHRRSVRLPAYDYASAGAYFVTLCTHRRAHLFGEVAEAGVCLSAFGRIVHDEWHRTPAVRPNVALDAFVVMPNHVHGVLVITEAGGRRGGDGDGRGTRRDGDGIRKGTPAVCPDGGGVHHGRAFGNAVPGSLSTIMRQYKSVVTKRINRMRGTPGAAVWQRGFYEHVVRDEKALARIRRYIARNPARWHRDRHGPRASRPRTR